MITSKCEKSRKFKYSVGYDIGAGCVKSFIGKDTINELEDHINESVNNHFYEQITTTTRKIYFDIDFDTENTSTKYKYMNIKTFDVFINKLIQTVNNELKLIKAVVMVQVAYKIIDKIKYISSCHIIYKTHKMNYLQIKDFVIYFNHKFNYKLDIRVYKKFQLFRFVGHCKFGKTNILKYYKIPYTFQDAFLSNINGLLLVKYNIVKTCTTTSKKAEKIEISNNTDIIKPIRKYNNMDIESIINDIKPTFWISKDWAMVTYILIKCYTLTNIDEWAKLSAINSNGKYTLEQNIKFISDWVNGDQVKHTRSGLPKLTSILNEYLPYELVYEALDQLDIDDLIKFIQSINKNVDITNIKEDFKIGGKILSSGNILFNPKDGFLRLNKKVYNYFYDYKLDRTQKMKYDFIFNKIDDIKIIELLKDFMINDKKLLIISGSWGVGKTHYILQTFLKLIGLDGVIASITPNNALNIEITEKFNKYGFQSFISHTEKRTKNKDLDHTQHKNLICSLESIKRVDEIGYIDYGFFDEFTSIFEHFEANTTNLTDNRKLDTFKTFERVLKNMNKIIVLDANINNEQIELLKTIINTDKITSIKIKQCNFSDVEHIFYNKEKSIDNQMKQDLEYKKRIVITTNSKKKTLQYFEFFKSLKCNIDKNILIINGDFIKIIQIQEVTNKKNEKIIHIDEVLTIQYNQKQKNNFFKNIEDNIIDYDIHILIYSPTVSMGISINQDLFNAVYGVFCTNSSPARECIQQIYRCRDIIDKKIHILADNFKDIITEKELDKYKSFLLLPATIRTSNLNITTYLYNQDKNYLDLRAINKKEILESNESFIQHFIYFLSSYNINIIYNNDVIKETVKNKIEINENIKNKEYEKYKDTRFISLEQYLLCRMCKESETLLIEMLRHGDTQDIFKYYDTNLTDDENNIILNLEYEKFNKIVRYSEQDEHGQYKKLSYGYYTYERALKLYDIYINSFEWFELYFNKITPHTAIIDYLEYDEKYELDILTSKYNNKFNSNDPHTNRIKKSNKVNLQKKIIESFKINLDSTTLITNQQFEQLLTDDLIKDIFDLATSNKLESNEPLPNKRNKKVFFKTYFLIIRSILKSLNIDMVYLNKHSTKPQDKIIFKQFKEYKFIYSEYINKPYTRFKLIDGNIIFNNVVGKKKKEIIKNKQMTYKKYDSTEIIKINRAYYNKLNNKLFKNVDSYKEYIPMISSEIKLLKDRLTPHQENDYLFEMMTDEANEKRKNEKLGDNMTDSNDIIKNILDDIISSIIITDITKKIYQHKKENFQIHDTGEIRKKYIKKHGIVCNYPKKEIVECQL